MTYRSAVLKRNIELILMFPFVFLGKIAGKLFPLKTKHHIFLFFRGVISSWINDVNRPVVFGGESLFFYKILPHVKKETKKIELCHLNTWIDFSQAFAKYIDIRIFSTPKIKRDVEHQYRRNNL